MAEQKPMMVNMADVKPRNKRRIVAHRHADGAFTYDLDQWAGYEYQIPADEIRTARQLLGWIEHLARKTWCDADLIGALCRHIDIIHDTMPIIPRRAWDDEADMREQP